MLVTSDLIIFTSRCCNCLLPKPFFSTDFSYLTIVESLPTYGTHYYEVKVKKKRIFHLQFNEIFRFYANLLNIGMRSRVILMFDWLKSV